MSFDFETPVDRRDSNSLKWAGASLLLSPAQAAADPLPMWLADMDFRAPEPVLQALQDAVADGVFGYALGATPTYLAAVTGWQARRFGWSVDPAWVVPVSGVITALKTVIQAFSSPGDTVLIQTPVYVHFHNDPLINGRCVSAAPLAFDGMRYRFDAQAFERALGDDTRIFILSNPHNPTGNVWSEAELRTMGEICLRRGVLVLADEIHQDFVLAKDRRHIPFASLSPAFADASVTCVSASKTFNLAGLQCANAIIPNQRLRQAFARRIDRNQVSRVNLLGMVATEAAYRHGADWVDGLVRHVASNQRHFAAGVLALGVGLRVIEMDSLYLAWIDCRGTGMNPAALEDHLLTKCRVWFDQGTKFGAEGAGFMRANIGCPRATVTEAIERLRAGWA
ncbi:MAG: pyridoxal phosphate-dependent aminotransferase [Burkholderiales bacterium]|nr:pyridoxal phosphate-dependent aminotransferase [Burkholderiales bacterium]MDE1925581.1 pyridoxal phosphate-dependent aminotransferase [Burkholderiales bacterium]MDE2158417.1 pyridoxal phosphate-dependent aminotransferase [Burkholderiales bacterium]MDE2503258.1 pyridoxal phosphate-dependent aminotransferase [Burkholderiales bacterium]